MMRIQVSSDGVNWHEIESKSWRVSGVRTETSNIQEIERNEKEVRYGVTATIKSVEIKFEMSAELSKAIMGDASVNEVVE